MKKTIIKIGQAQVNGKYGYAHPRSEYGNVYQFEGNKFTDITTSSG